jgi:hypothetical protein
MKWLAYIIKYPGRKTLTAILLLGPQGSGKNLFTNKIAELTSPYSHKNIDDRRNLDLQCVKPDNADEYFASLGAEVDALVFLPTLFTYLIQYDVPIDYDFVHTLPMTELKQVIQQTYKNPFEQFVTRYHQRFVEGWESKDCRQVAERELTADRTDKVATEHTKKGLAIDLQRYCGGTKQIRRGEAKVYVYRLLPNYVEAFRPTEQQICCGEIDVYLDESV